MPDLARLADEVARTRQPRAASTTGEREAALAVTFGAWKGLVDAEQPKRELAEAQSDDRPAPQL